MYVIYYCRHNKKRQNKKTEMVFQPKGKYRQTDRYMSKKMTMMKKVILGIIRYEDV